MRPLLAGIGLLLVADFTAAAGLSSACRASPYFQQHRALSRVLSDQLEVAGATARIALSQRIADLQETRRKFEALTPPKCARVYHAATLSAIDGEIDTYLLFMSDAPLAAREMREVTDFRWETVDRILRGPRPPSPPTPTPTPTTCCQCGEIIRSDDTMVSTGCGYAHWVCPRDRKTPTPVP